MSDVTITELPPDVQAWIGERRYVESANFPVERGYIWTSCASVENGNPLFWDDAVADELTGGPIAPPSTISLWLRPHHWQPGERTAMLPLQVHFDLKDRLGLPEAVMSDSEVVFDEPVRPGDVITSSQVLRSVSGAKTTKLGTGRFWVIDVEYRNHLGDRCGVETFTGFGYSALGGSAAPNGAPTPSPPPDTERRSAGARRGRAAGLRLADVAVGQHLPELAVDVTATTVVLGALATRDWRPMHHDVDFAINRNGIRNIFLNTPNQQAWFERYLTDWTGPRGRLGRMKFRMLTSVFPDDRMVFSGTVEGVTNDDTGCGWVAVAVALRVGETVATSCTARIALPTADDDNPWRRRGTNWTP